MTAAPQASLNRWMWLGAGLLMLAEFLLFDRMTSLHHTGIYPRWNDQIQYLREAYTAYEHSKAHGLFAGLKLTLTKTALQGTLHDTCALLVFTLVGSASRSAALSLNMLVFLAWQASLLFAIPRLTGSRALGWMAFGLLPCVAWAWAGEPGSAVDFRLDHAAMCLMGLTSVAALLSDGFRSRPWTLALGVATGVTLLERFITGAYFAFILPASAIWILFGDNRGPRLRNLGLAALVAAAMALPVFWLNRTAIYTYYWVGHVTGAESAARLPGLDIWRSVQFVFGHLGRMHLGWFFGSVAAVLALPFLALSEDRPRQPLSRTERDWLFIALAFTLLPAAVLCVHPQKSEYVLGVLVPGAVLLVLLGWSFLWRRCEFPNRAAWLKIAPVGLAVAAVGAGGWLFTTRQLRPPHTSGFLADIRTVNQIADRIFAATRDGAVANPAIAVDQIVDYLDAQILQVICYERHKVWINFVIQLPNSILEDKDEAMLYRMKLCDFVVLTDEMGGDGHWPYDKQMRRLYPQMKEWCEGHLQRAGTFALFGRKLSLYQRPAVPVTHP